VGGKARFIGADLSHPDDVAALANAAGELDVLVNNSGPWWFGPTADLDREAFDALFAGNVRGPYYLVAAIAPGMVARGSGSIINVSSMVAEVGLPVAAAYGATKGAIEALTRSWAAEFSPQGVRVNAVSPGPVYTDGADHEQIEQLGTTTLLRRAAHPAEIAQVIAFLASPRASYVTGATVSVDGGRTAI
jgi:NAD(P)-dependent dehydrogenase (short-subunit alcohol dehydrogenase family)